VLLLFAGTGSVVPLETFAVFESVVGEDAAGAVIVIEIAGAAPTASVGRVHVTVPAAKPQVQPVPDADTNDDPAGSTSLTLTLEAEPGPLFETASEYVTGVPPNAVAVPVVFRMLRLAFRTVSTFVDELFPGVGSLVDDETVAVLETVPEAGAVTLIVIGFA